MSKPKPDPKSATKNPSPRTSQSSPSANAPTPDEQLDEALEETFPASDPIAIDPPDTREDLPRPGTSPASMHAARHAKPDTKSHKDAQGKPPEPATASKSASKSASKPTSKLASRPTSKAASKPDPQPTEKHRSKHH